MLKNEFLWVVGLGELNVHPHYLRHSTGYYLSERGADRRLIQAYLGHREIRHTVQFCFSVK
jgi:site-specific recombinase XerD